jgi:hypothetical protein
MINSQLNNKSYRDKTIAEFFARNSEPVNVDGVIHSTPFRKVNANGDPEFIGRKKLVGTDGAGNKVYEKIKDDVQFAGKAPSYDGINDFSLSNFTVHEWLGEANQTPVYTKYCLLGAELKTTQSGNYGGLITLDPTISGNSGIVLELNSGGTLRILVYYRRVNLTNSYTEFNSTIPINDGLFHKIVLHINVISDVAAIKLYIDGALNNSASIADFKEVRFLSGTELNSRMAFGAHSNRFYPNNHASMVIRYCDLFESVIFSDAQVASYLADRDYLNANLYARFNFNQGAGNKTYAENDNTKYLEHFNINPSTFWVDDSDVDYSPLNEKGYSKYVGTTLNGSNEYYTLSPTDIHGGVTGLGRYIVIQVLIRTSAVVTNSNPDVILADYSSVAPGDYSLIARHENNGKITFYVDGAPGTTSSSDSVTSVKSINDGLLHRVTFLHDIRIGQPLRFRIYIDGVLDKVSDNASGLGGYDKNLTSPLTFGRIGDNNSQYFNGDLFEISIFNEENPLTLGQLESYAASGYVDSVMPSHKWVFDKETVVDQIGGIVAERQSTGNFNTVEVINPASLTNPIIDTLGTPLEYKGKLAPRAQLVNAPALLLNGVDQSVNPPDLPFGSSYIGISNKSLFMIVEPNNDSFFYIGSGPLYQVFYKSGNNLYIKGADAQAATVITFPVTFDPSERLYIVMTCNTTNQYTFYINGIRNTVGATPINTGNGFRLTNLFSGVNGKVLFFSCSYSPANSYIPTEKEISDFSEGKFIPTLKMNVIYTFSEGNGTTIYDVSGNGNHGTVVNPVLPDIWGTQNVFHYNHVHGYQQVTKFNGTNNYINLGTDPKYALRTEFTLACWIKADPNQIATNQGIIAKYDYNGPNTVYSLGFSGEKIYISTSLSGASAGPPVFSARANFNHKDGKFHHVAFTWKGIIWKLYIDGVEITYSVSSNGGSFTSSSILADRPSTPLLIGAFRNGSPTQFLDATIVDSYISDLFSSPSQIVELYNTGQITGREAVYNEPIDPATILGTQNFITSNVPNGVNTNKVKGSNQGSIWNGASDIQFPDIPEMPVEFRGAIHTENNLYKSGFKNLLYNKKQILVTKDSLSVLESTRDSLKTALYFYDLFPQLTRAFSVRRLSSNGKAFQARKTTGVSNIDIEWGGDFYNETQLATFCGTEEGFINHYYDATSQLIENTTVGTVNAPLIYDGVNGYVDINGNLSCKFFLYSRINIPFTSNISGQFSLFLVGQILNTSANYYPVRSDGYAVAGKPGFSIFITTAGRFQFYDWNGSSYTLRIDVANSNSFGVYEVSRNSSGNIVLRINNSIVSTSTSVSTLSYTSDSHFRVGSGQSASVGQNSMNLSEVLLFNNSIDNERTAISNNILNNYNAV